MLLRYLRQTFYLMRDNRPAQPLPATLPECYEEILRLRLDNARLKASDMTGRQIPLPHPPRVNNAVGS